MSTRMKWFLVRVFTMLHCFLLQKGVAQTGSMSIKKAIETALANNRSLRADSLYIAITGSKNREVAGLYLPQVNYASGTEYNPAIARQTLPGYIVGQPSKEYVPVKFGTSYSFRSGVEVSQTVYRKELLLQIKEAGLQTDISKTRYRLSKEELVYEVASRYYALQTNAEMIRTTEFDYQNMKDILRIAKAQYETGVLKRIEYESLQINVANMQSELNQLQTQYNEQLVYFNYLLGLPPFTLTVISDSISQDLRELVKATDFAQRADIQLANQMLLSKQNELKRLDAQKLPVINTYFRFNYQSQFNEVKHAFDNDFLYKTSTVGLSVSVPLFDGNRRKSRVRTATTELEQLKLENRQKLDKAQMELISATGTFNNNREQFLINKGNLVLATDVFSSRKALYTEGVSSLMELLDAERELSKARNLHIQSLINVQTSWLNMHRAKGSLLTDFLQSI